MTPLLTGHAYLGELGRWATFTSADVFSPGKGLRFFFGRADAGVARSEATPSMSIPPASRPAYRGVLDGG